MKKGNFKMVTNLTKLHNTLMMIETKGENTKLMRDCLVFLEKLIATESASHVEQTEHGE